MAFNRLRLDFSLQTADERIAFLNDYLPTIEFTMTEHEQETLSDYILWGKNPVTGLNSQQDGNITIKEWAPVSNVESLDSLKETPGFNENQLQPLNGTSYKVRKTKFNRQEALEKAPPDQKTRLEELFKEIDRVELTINYYDLRVGKRKTPPRPSLLAVFTEEERADIEQKASKLIQRKYLKLRHYLVELRNEQYTFRDTFVTTVGPHAGARHSIQIDAPNFALEDNILVRPMGLRKRDALSEKIFKDIINPEEFTDEDLEAVSNLLWRPHTELEFDFRNPDHVVYIYKNYYDIQSDAAKDPNEIYGAAASLLYTLEYYQNQANLSDAHLDILRLKVEGCSNTEIQFYINSKYKTTYNPNYISTIYRHKIISSICHAAENHELIMGNVFWPDNFKVCKDCGELRLRNAEFFMRQGKSSDGFVPRCKKCQSIKRATLKAQKEARILLEKQ